VPWNNYRSHCVIVHWHTLEEDVRTFCLTCLHCVATIGGDRVPRPLGESMHADKPNELLHMDFLYMGPSHTMESYLLLLKGDLSGYLWLWPCRKADSATTVEALVTWFTTIGVLRTWVSDQGSHFKNRTIEGVQRALRSQHHYTTAYTPWANGTVERACREVLRAVRGLLLEFKLRPADWPKVHRIVQSVLNNSPSPQRVSVAPITPFTGLPPDSPLSALVATDDTETLALPLIKARQAMNIAELFRLLDEVHKNTARRPPVAELWHANASTPAVAWPRLTSTWAISSSWRNVIRSLSTSCLYVGAVHEG
jgi:Integrase core domain